MAGEANAAMAEPCDGLRDLLAIDQGNDLPARTQVLDRQFPVGGPDHRAARVADGLDSVGAGNDEGVRGTRLQVHVVHRENDGSAAQHRQVVGSCIQRHRISGEVGTGDDELVAPCDIRDRLGRNRTGTKSNVIELDNTGVGSR